MKQEIPPLDQLKAILDTEARAISAIPISDEYHRAIRLILTHVHERGGKLVTSGMGKAGQIAGNMATTFTSTGTPALFLHPSEAQHGDLGILGKEDLMLLISNSGKTQEILTLMDLAERLVPEMPFICITGNAESELAERSDVTLFTGAPGEVCPLGLTPTTSITAMSVIGDLLVVSTMSAIGFDYEAYSKRHYGGHLGRLARERSF